MATPFCFTKDILYQKQGIMTEENENDYVPFVVNRVLSNYPDCIFFVQDMNLYPKISKRMQYDYLYNSIRQAKRPFIQYPKATKSDYISLVMEVYGYNTKKAKEALAILSPEQLEEIKKMYEKGG